LLPEISNIVVLLKGERDSIEERFIIFLGTIHSFVQQLSVTRNQLNFEKWERQAVCNALKQ